MTTRTCVKYRRPTKPPTSESKKLLARGKASPNRLTRHNQKVPELHDDAIKRVTMQHAIYVESGKDKLHFSLRALTRRR